MPVRTAAGKEKAKAEAESVKIYTSMKKRQLDGQAHDGAAV